jgi:HNH/ENDO VII superfamily nuclease with conserved GHE residues
MGEKEHQLRNGGKVVLSDWNGLEPPEHGKALLAKDWDPDASRIGLKFYKSTEEYMRNEWAEKHMHPTKGTLKDENVLLYYHQQTGSWHTADALDIDHKTQWKDHLTGLKVGNMAEAQMAYNDVSNLRLLPSAVNRARDSAEKIVETHGLDSKEWDAWCKKRFGFDPAESRPAFDPEKDAANRRPSTLEAEWTAKHTRKDLAFDTRVEGKWFEAELEKSRAGEAVVKRPVFPFDDMKVPLFRCAASGQLCTRDAFDIDHQIAFETLLKVLPDHAIDGKLSKADVLDAYNETSNLRLVSRSANASHEWELTARGEYRDAEKEKPEGRNEFKGFLVDAPMSPQEQKMLAEALAEYSTRQHYKLQVWGQLKDAGIIDFKDPRAAQGAVTQLSDPSHPDNGRFAKVMQKLDELDPKHEVLPTQAHRDNLAAALTLESRAKGLPDIEAVAKGGKHGELLFAAYGVNSGNPTHVNVAVTVGAMTPMAYSTAMDDQQRAQQLQQAVSQVPGQQKPVQL